MAITEAFTGTDAVGATEWSCPRDVAYDIAQRQTTAGVYQVFLDVTDMILTDVLQIRVWEVCRSGDTQQIVYECILRDVQSTKLWAGPSLVLMNGWDVSLKAIAGTITVLWSIRKVA